MKRILIIGATGVLGSAVSKHFLKAGFVVKCFVRNRKKATGLETEGAQIIVGDLTDEETIKDAVKEVDVVITTAHAMLGKGKNSSDSVDNKAHKSIIDAAVASGVQQLIYTSVQGVSADHPIDFIRTKFAVEQHLINSGLNYTILRLPAFMEWHVHNLLGKSIVAKNKVTILGKGDNPINFIAVDDVVKALNIIVLNKEYFKKIVNIGGPQNLSRNEVASTYARLLNVTPKVGHVPVRVLNVLSRLIKPFHPGLARIMRFSIYTDTSDETMEIDESIQQFGLQPTSVEAFIKKQLQQSR